MVKTDRYEILSDAYRNQTKLSVIILLAEHEKMTVTHMSKYIGVSRSNLYHFVSQMVEDGILNEPEIVPKKNYVEKYYSLNEEMFGSVKREEWKAHLKTLDTEEIIRLMSSILMAYSIQLKIVAERISRFGKVEAEYIKNWLMSHPISTTYATLGPTTFKKAEKQIEELYHVIEESGREGEGEGNRGMLLTVLLPIILGGLK